jgi:hypothetical protein
MVKRAEVLQGELRDVSTPVVVGGQHLVCKGASVYFGKCEERSGMDMWLGLLKQKLRVGFWYGNVTRCLETPCT